MVKVGVKNRDISIKGVQVALSLVDISFKNKEANFSLPASQSALLRRVID